MTKNKMVQYEYSIKCPIELLYSHISTPRGLEGWFADKVEADNNIYTFTWDKSNEKAKFIGSEEYEYVRFHWLTSDDTEDYVEIRIEWDELTSEVALMITDFVNVSEDDAFDSNKRVWDKQIQQLMHLVGS